MKTSDRIVRRLERFTRSSVAGSGRLQALLSLGGAAVAANELDFWTQLFRLLEDEFGFGVASVYLQEDATHFVRRNALNMSVGVISRLEREQLPALANAVLAEGAAVFIDRNSDEARRKLVAAPARCAFALPMIHDEQLLGVIEANSSDAHTFDIAERDWLKMLGEQAARWYAVIAQMQRLERRLAETNATLKRLTAQLDLRERQALAILRDEWDGYLKRRGSAIGFDLEVGAQEQLLRADDLPDALRAVMERGELSLEVRDDVQTLSAPILVRGILLGAMTFTLPPGRRLNERQTELARNVAERLGSALENTRLFEQSRTLAQRERQANESAARLQGIVDVQTLIDLAAQEFREVLGAVYTRVSLNLANATQEVS